MKKDERTRGIQKINIETRLRMIGSQRRPRGIKAKGAPGADGQIEVLAPVPPGSLVLQQYANYPGWSAQGRMHLSLGGALHKCIIPPGGLCLQKELNNAGAHTTLLCSALTHSALRSRSRFRSPLRPALPLFLSSSSSSLFSSFAHSFVSLFPLLNHSTAFFLSFLLFFFHPVALSLDLFHLARSLLVVAPSSLPRRSLDTPSGQHALPSRESHDWRVHHSILLTADSTPELPLSSRSRRRRRNQHTTRGRDGS